MLVRDDVIFVFGIDRLMLRRHIDIFRSDASATEVFEEVGNTGLIEVDIGMRGIARLVSVSKVMAVST